MNTLNLNGMLLFLRSEVKKHLKTRKIECFRIVFNALPVAMRTAWIKLLFSEQTQ